MIENTESIESKESKIEEIKPECFFISYDIAERDFLGRSGSGSLLHCPKKPKHFNSSNYTKKIVRNHGFNERSDIFIKYITKLDERFVNGMNS